MLALIAKHSLLNRRKSALLTLLSLVMSIAVLLSVEHIREQARESFNRTISGVDLIVGAPSGQLNLLLYSVFRMGSPTNSIAFDSYNRLKNNKQVAWAIPISLGDSHKGFRVLGTNLAYFEHYKFGNKQPLELAEGGVFENVFSAVIGADVAKKLNYKLHDNIVIAHGIGNTSFKNHDDSPFVITGILKPTGTPVDKTVHVSLAGIETIHLPPAQVAEIVQNPDKAADLEPKLLTSVLIGLKSKFATFAVQRALNNDKQDRLMAVLPGVAMAELWQMMGNVENVLRIISVLVLLSSLFGLATMLLASMRERRHEIAVLRILGAGPAFIFTLVLLEALMLSALAIVIAFSAVSLGLFSLGDWLSASYGLFLSANLFTATNITTCGIILLATVITALIPAIEAYRNALHVTLSAK